jgi:UDP-3-O-[3-hydroxymyristoyl] glucosamine N-acyltransferase
MKSYTVQEINEVLNGVLLVLPQKITAPEQLGVASDSEITFIGNKNTKNFGLHLKLALQL